MSGKEATAGDPGGNIVNRASGRIGYALRRYAIFLVLAVLIVFFDSFEPAFLRVNNLFSVLQAVAVVALLGIGVTVTLAVDGFDLSGMSYR
jgi:simple sugar transport system permease protein